MTRAIETTNNGFSAACSQTHSHLFRRPRLSERIESRNRAFFFSHGRASGQRPWPSASLSDSVVIEDFALRNRRSALAWPVEAFAANWRCASTARERPPHHDQRQPVIKWFALTHSAGIAKREGTPACHVTRVVEGEARHTTPRAMQRYHRC